MLVHIWYKQACINTPCPMPAAGLAVAAAAGAAEAGVDARPHARAAVCCWRRRRRRRRLWRRPGRGHGAASAAVGAAAAAAARAAAWPAAGAHEAGAGLPHQPARGRLVRIFAPPLPFWAKFEQGAKRPSSACPSQSVLDLWTPGTCEVLTFMARVLLVSAGPRSRAARRRRAACRQHLVWALGGVLQCCWL